jgi:two-component system, sensor histidine kinase
MTRHSRGVEESARRIWVLALIGAVIAAALATVVALQVRQFQLLDQTTHYQDDYLQVNLGQLETEHLRLLMQWRESLLQPPIDQAALQLRYDIFVSRVDLLDTGRARRMLHAGVELRDVLQELRSFIAEADRLLGPGAPAAVDAQALQALWPRVQELGPKVRALVLEGSHGLSNQAAVRNTALRQTNRTTIALTVLLALAAFGFAVLALSQFRRLEQRRRSLEHLTVELRAARSRAEAASDSKSVFLANMSHEIRTPLQGVLGMLALLADSALDPRQRARLNTARESADHLLLILNDILDLAKLEAGKLATTVQAVDVRALTAEVEALMRAQAHAKGLAMTVHVDAGIPPWLQLDQTRVRQILLNLCSNAIKFTASGHIALRVGTADGRLRLEVEDTGIGIDAPTLAQLFQRFGRGDESRARRHGGAGLGLEISRQLARLMGGDIEVASTPGKGSTFVLSLPIVAAQAPAAVSGPSPVPAAPSQVSPRRVLVVDDNAVNREYTGVVLARLGHQVFEACDGREAIAQVRDQTFDLVLMDLHMPEVDGLEATRAIRALHGAAGRVTIFALTADAFADTRAACLAAGMDGFVTKPVTPSTLAGLLVLPGSEGPQPTGQLPGSDDDSTALVDDHFLNDVLRVVSPDKAAALTRKFVSETQNTTIAMRAALSEGDHVELHRCAHRFRGMAASFGLKALSSAAVRLQAAADAGDVKAIDPALNALERLVEPSQRALQARLDSNAGA